RGRVGAGQALEAGEHVLEGVVERMPHMQRAGDVGRRDDDAIGLGVAPLRPAGAKCARLLPLGVDAPLDRGGLVCLVDHVSVRRFRGKKPAALRPVNACYSPPSFRPAPLLVSASPAEKVPTRSIILLAAAGFASQAMVRVTDSLLPQIAADFGTTVGEASIVVAAYAVSHGSIQLIIGPVGDRFGKYRTVTVMCALATILVA